MNLDLPRPSGFRLRQRDFEHAVADLGSALTIDPELASALIDRALIELERTRLLATLGRGGEARLAVERARKDLTLAGGLAPGSKQLEESLTLLDARAAEVGSIR